MTHQGEQHDTLLGRYEKALLGVFGLPSLVIERGEGAYVWDTDGKRYLDLVAGIAVNVLGHNHPELVAAVSHQIGQVAHISNFYTSRPQIELAERLLSIAGAPDGSRVFFANSGTEAIEGEVAAAVAAPGGGASCALMSCGSPLSVSMDASR